MREQYRGLCATALLPCRDRCWRRALLPGELPLCSPADCRIRSRRPIAPNRPADDAHERPMVGVDRNCSPCPAPACTTSRRSRAARASRRSSERRALSATTAKARSPVRSRHVDPAAHRRASRAQEHRLAHRGISQPAAAMGRGVTGSRLPISSVICGRPLRIKGRERLRHLSGLQRGRVGPLAPMEFAMRVPDQT